MNTLNSTSVNDLPVKAKISFLGPYGNKKPERNFSDVPLFKTSTHSVTINLIYIMKAYSC